MEVIGMGNSVRVPAQMRKDARHQAFADRSHLCQPEPREKGQRWCRHLPKDSTAKTELTTGAADGVEEVRTGLQADDLQQAVTDHLRYSIGRLPSVDARALLSSAGTGRARPRAAAVVASTQTFLDLSRKVVCYLSAEFLMGRSWGTIC